MNSKKYIGIGIIIFIVLILLIGMKYKDEMLARLSFFKKSDIQEIQFNQQEIDKGNIQENVDKIVGPSPI